MLKKLLTAAVAAAFCLSAAACSSAPKGYAEIKKAQEAAGALSAGRIIATSSYKKGGKSGSITSELLFRANADSTIAYCQTQFDRDNKAVYCEYCDGKQVERWLIGKGWNSPEESTCTRESPHRYMRLLETPIDQKAIDSIALEADGQNARYVVALNPEWLNTNTYTDGTETAVSETVTITLAPDGTLLNWQDEAVVTDVAAKLDCTYRLAMALTENDAATDITKPELRNNFQVGADAELDAEVETGASPDEAAEAGTLPDEGTDAEANAEMENLK